MTIESAAPNAIRIGAPQSNAEKPDIHSDRAGSLCVTNPNTSASVQDQIVDCQLVVPAHGIE